MIVHENRQVVVCCDSCGETHDAETKDFREAVESAKDAGFKIMKDGAGEWVHYCPGCVEDKKPNAKI